MPMRCILIIAAACCLLSITACAAWPFGNGPQDIQVKSVSAVDFNDQSQLAWANLKSSPPKMIYRIDFTTSTDLLALAKKNDYNVSSMIGLCRENGVEDMGLSFGYVYWNKLRIYSDAKETPDYAAEVAKGTPFTYLVFATKWVANATQGSMCFTLAGGNMLGKRLRSNVAVIPNGQQPN